MKRVDTKLTTRLLDLALAGDVDQTGACAALLLAAASLAVQAGEPRDVVIAFVGRMYDGAIAAQKRDGAGLDS
jgi:hypothetical protein